MKIKYRHNGDWRTFALEHLEKDILYCARRYRIIGMDIEDIVQELRYHLLRKLDRFDRTKSRLRTWAMRVMRNRLIDIHQSSERLPLNRSVYMSDEQNYDNQERDFAISDF